MRSKKNDRSILVEWNVPNQWRVAMIENVYEIGGEFFAMLIIHRKRIHQRPFPLTTEVPATKGYVHYRLEFKLTLDQYAQYQGEHYAGERDQRWALPTVRGAHQAAWNYAKAQGHNPQLILGNTRRGKTPVESPDAPTQMVDGAIQQITQNVFWRIVYIKTGDGITAYWVDTDLKSIRANPHQASWEHNYRELPKLRVSVDELNISNWGHQRRQINRRILRR
ncbi:hypothetical protein KC571_03385 [candidate division WWE3 bacterium]|uniref:Uncharacterized protein n=1 Tax=candidate division WWE3 bacterium TaxID=2053526 RepID=A0A955LHL6_UNCKA|nr:hypothetical protein [candidate division WWE3 bacterium]